jgi:hypothetical protein
MEEQVRNMSQDGDERNSGARTRRRVRSAQGIQPGGCAAAAGLALLVALNIPAAVAFESGGHHYTLAAIYHTYPQAQTGSNQTDDERVVEAFCAQLPDLAMELDAVTQRVRVFKSGRDWQWGAFGRCSTPISRHMVATQSFLHSLTGTDVANTRQAAVGIIQDIDRDIVATPNPQERADLYCARGFAAHLLGDSFAHGRLNEPERLYATGTGHWKDGHQPDYMLTRDSATYLSEGRSNANNSWSAWVRGASAAFIGRDDGSSGIEVLKSGIDPEGQKDSETRLRTELINYATPQWSPYQPAIYDWLKPGNSDSSWVRRKYNELSSSVLRETCQDQIDRGPASQTGGQGVPVAVRPQCARVWALYRDYAIRNFQLAGDIQSEFSSSCTKPTELSDGRN